MTDLEPSKRVYFPGLSGIRFICCNLIIAFHVNQLKGVFGFERYDFSSLGPSNLYMNLFFVLSGFLITYLLLAERKLTKTINLRKYFIRRVLRIWPLYFAVIFLGFVVFPQLAPFQFPEKNLTDYPYYFEMFLSFLLLFPHLHGIVYDVNTTMGPLWSIGVEEQFYLLWPFLIHYLKRPVIVLCSLIVIFLGLRHIDHIVALIGVGNSGVVSRLQIASLYFDKFRLGTMAIGGLLAICYINKVENIQKVLHHRFTQLGTWAIFLCLIVFPDIRPQLLEHEVYSVLTGIILFNLATNPKTIVSLDQKWLRHSGELTYSLYVFHIPCILTCIYFLDKQLRVDLDTVMGNALLFTSSTLFTLCISYFSYTYFELRFIRLKDKFAVVKSGTQPVK